jgi:Ca2+:H+ antiporter
MDQKRNPIIKNIFSLNTLLLFIPLVLYLEFYKPQEHTLIFFTACLGIIPLAGWMGHATEQIADRAGEGIGGLLNATFGNAAELIIAIVALKAGQTEIVKASLTGSIIGNLLLVLGASFLAGGLFHKIQEYNPLTARAQAQMLLLSSVALIIPALFHISSVKGLAINEGAVSLWMAGLLMVVYICSLVFSLKTHPELSRGPLLEEEHNEGAEKAWSLPLSLTVLALATVLIAWLAEILVGSVEEAAHAIGMSKIFVGVIIVAIIGNAAEHSTAVMAALKNRVNLSLGIAIGSSTQIALFVTPLLIFLIYALAPAPMNLVFSGGEVFAILISTTVTAHITGDGHSQWFTGVLLFVLYLVLGVGFYFVPVG